MRAPCACLVIGVLGLAAGAAAEPAPGGPRPSSPSPQAFRSEIGRDEAVAPAAAPFGSLGPRRVEAVKSGVAAAAAALLLWGLWLRRAGRADAHRRLRDAALLGLGVLGVACWVNLGRFHYSHFAHRADAYHHFVGAKYFPELGYQRLYACTAVAEAEAGRGRQIAGRPMRDLASNRMLRAEAALADREACRRHFSADRWQAFRRDVEWFRARIPPRQWRRTQMDHGYNASPVWTVFGMALSGAPAAERLEALLWLDPLLVALTGAAVIWAFGWRTACVAAVFWGTNPFAHFGWTGGAFLRQDWLAASVVSLCLLRRGRPATAGFLLAWAAALRLFPLLVFGGIGLKALGEVLRERRLHLAPAHLRYGLGALAGTLLLVTLSLAVAGRDAWPAFVANTRVHLATPLQNHMGLKTVVAHEPGAMARADREIRGEDPFAPWQEARRRGFESRRWVFAVLVAGYLALLARAVAGREDWLAATLGVGLVPIAVELTGYYLAILLAFALLWPRRESIGVALCGLVLATRGAASRWSATDDVAVLGSLAVVAFVVYATVLFAFDRRDARPPLTSG